MVVAKFIVPFLIAALLAALATLSGCSMDPGSGATGNLDVQTPFGSIKGDFQIVPPAIVIGPAAPAATQPGK